MDDATPSASLQGFTLGEELAVIRAEGADADSFLQGQLSNDLRKLSETQGQISSYNSPKGRMLAVLTLTRHAGCVDLELPRSLLDPVLRRLRMFVMRSKVTLQESPESVIGLRGSTAEAALQAAKIGMPTTALAMTQSDGLRVLRRHGDVPRFTLQGPPSRLQALIEQWGIAESVDTTAWALDDLRAGLPVVRPATQDRFIAPMANLDLLGGIAFDKGCYTGQEIIARLHYLGQLKRRMFCCRGVGATPEPGASVHDGDNEQAVGEIVNAISIGEGHFEAAAVLQLTHAESSQLHVGASALELPQAFIYR